MSELTATNCGCNNNASNGCGNFIWIILLLCMCGGNDSGFGGFGGNNCGGNNNGCDALIWILLLSCICGNGNSCC